MVETKTNSVVLTAVGAIGTSGAAKYIHAITINSDDSNDGTASIYDGIDASGTLKWRIRVSATAGDSRSISGLNIWCPNGAYLDLTDCGSVAIEYSGP